MFEKKGEYYTNRDNEFLKNSDLVIFYKSEPKKLVKNYVVIGGEEEFSKVDIPKTSKKLPLLLARLAYVFEVYDEKFEIFYNRSRSGCYFCFFMRQIEWVWLWEKHPTEYKKAMELKSLVTHG